MGKNALNQAVFEPMCSGFSDSSAALRELTLKATLVLVPYLFQPNLEKLSRYLVRLQSDQEASIRTNTVIFFSKLAPYLTDTTRQKLLLRALKDNFKPCRLAALQSTLKAKGIL
jgi:SCY1-like protein 1